MIASNILATLALARQPRHVVTVDVLSRLWLASGDRLAGRCNGLTDAEFFWTPVEGSWTVRPDPTASSGWGYDYEFVSPQPAPVPTIAWRLVHIAADNWIYWEHAFGAGVRNFPDLEVPSTALDAVQWWQDSRAPITTWLSRAHDDSLAEQRPSHLGNPKTAGEVVAILIDEQVHHGAEIALLRDLFQHPQRRDP
jgi:hypothetical protein